jgi:phenylpropionate dioxygenase-like ring-hydroxylating dioxygenase large terminal subunit
MIMDHSILQTRSGDRPFSNEPSTSHTMPARFYIDPTVYEREKEAIFNRSWWFAGHKSQVAKPGQYITTSIHDQSIIIARGADDEIRAFYNVCQHRGHELVKGAGSARILVCPYHAWSYDLDGKLRGAPNTGELAGFDKCAFALKNVRVEEFCGLLFVNLDPDAKPFAELSGDLEAELRHYCPSIDSLVYAHRHNYDVASNWKVLIDNFLECYHCGPAHRDFVNLVDMKTYKSRVCGIYSSHTSQAAQVNNSAFKFEKGDVEFGYAAWYVWPNLTIWIYPGETNLSTLQMIPAGPERTIEHLDWFLPKTEPTAQLAAAMAYMDEVLQPEDISLCESVQRGLHSKGYNQGRFVIDNMLTHLSEHAVHHFQKMVVDALGADIR